MSTFDPPSDRCLFSWELYDVGPEAIRIHGSSEAARLAFASRMDGLISTGARIPTEISMSEWHYMQAHAEKCDFCMKKFERLARESRTTGPQTLRH